MTAKPSGTPNTAADTGWMSNQSDWPAGNRSTARTAGALSTM